MCPCSCWGLRVRWALSFPSSPNCSTFLWFLEVTAFPLGKHQCFLKTRHLASAVTGCVRAQTWAFLAEHLQSLPSKPTHLLKNRAFSGCVKPFVFQRSQKYSIHLFTQLFSPAVKMKPFLFCVFCARFVFQGTTVFIGIGWIKFTILILHSCVFLCPFLFTS